MNTPFLEVRGLSRNFARRLTLSEKIGNLFGCGYREQVVHAVDDVSLSVHEGEVLGLVGESGSGKSVTAMSVAGLLPRKQCDYSGTITLDGQDLLYAHRSQLRKIQGKDIGVVFQEPMSCMDPLMKIGPQVSETLRIHTDLPKEERRRLALEAMGVTRLPRIRHGVLPQLSPQLFSATLYRFDVNIREASVLGLAGAGGIGAPLIFAMNQYAWNQVSTLALGMILLAWLVDLISTACRRRSN